VDHSLGDLPAASGHQLAATATATLFEYYACVAEKQYLAAHTGLFQTGASAPAPPINAIIFSSSIKHFARCANTASIYARS
jgi:hypothetical protein